jgi:hypothetical protein
VTGVAGAWETTVHLDTPPPQIQQQLRLLLGPRTVPPSAGYHPPSGLAVLHDLDAHSFMFTYAWSQQRFTLRGTLAPSGPEGTDLSISVRPAASNAIVMGLVGLGIAVLIVTSIIVSGFAVIGVPFAALWGAYAWWLTHESPKHAVGAASALLERLGAVR